MNPHQRTRTGAWSHFYWHGQWQAGRAAVAIRDFPCDGCHALIPAGSHTRRLGKPRGFYCATCVPQHPPVHDTGLPNSDDERWHPARAVAGCTYCAWELARYRRVHDDTDPCPTCHGSGRVPREGEAPCNTAAPARSPSPTA